MKRRNWTIVLAAALSAAALAACGGGSSTGGGRDGAGEEEARLEFAECMRAHGVEMEDPKPGQSIDVGGGNPTTRRALAACNGKLGEGGQELSATEDQELNEGALALAQCMREEGIEMGDPEILGPGKFHLDLAGLDPNSPAFEAAQEACQGKLPELNTDGVGG